MALPSTRRKNRK